MLAGVACYGVVKCCYSRVYNDTCLETRSDSKKHSKIQSNAYSLISIIASLVSSWTISKTRMLVLSVFIALQRQGILTDANLAIGTDLKPSATCFMRLIRPLNHYLISAWLSVMMVMFFSTK